MHYYFGLSWKGLIIFLLPMIPNLFYFLVPESNIPRVNTNHHLILDIMEHVSQAIFVSLIIFVVSKQTSKLLCPYTIGMAILLIFYYLLWILYYTGNGSLVVLLGLAILPVVYFILGEICIHNYLAIIPTVIFGVIHITITYINGK